MKAVNLGLSVLWADRNFGAETINDFGEYVRWKYDPMNLLYLCKYPQGRVRIPNGWRLPTDLELCELLEKCQTVLKFLSGTEVVGPSGKQIFLPFGGYYNDYWIVIPDKKNEFGVFLSSSFSRNRDIRFLFTGRVYGKYYNNYVENKGDIRGFLNIRLVKDRPSI